MRFSRRTIHEVDERSSPSLYALLREFLDAYIERTKRWSEPEVGNTAITQKLDTIIEMLQSLNGVPSTLGMIEQRLETAHGLIFTLDGKVNTFMSTQEERLKGVQSALSGIAEGINTLQQQVADLKANNPELDDEISGIEATVKSIADDINGVVPEPAPTEPTPEGGVTP